MKKLYITLGLVAAMSLFAACTADENPIAEPENEKVLVTFTAEKAGDDTRTAIEVGKSSVSYVWTEEDKSFVKVYQVTSTTDSDGNEQEKTTELTKVSVSISSDNKIMTITAEADASDSYLFRANVAGDRTTGGSPRIKGTQNPATESFDPTTDILVSDDLSTTTLDNLSFTFRRQVVVNEMTLKNLVAGEKVSEVKIVTDKEKGLTGFYNGSSITGQSNQITLSYDKVEVPENGQLTTWFVTMPNTGHTLTVTVTTDAHVYTKTFAKTIDFNLGSYNRFGVALLKPEVITNYSGAWVITGDGKAATAYVSGNFYPASAVSIDAENKTVTINGDETEPYKMTFTLISEGDYAGLYTIVDNGGKYLSAIGGGNYLQGLAEPTKASYWNVAENTNGTYDIVATKADATQNNLRANGSDTRFSCYNSTSTMSKVVLYPFDNVITRVIEESGDGTKNNPFNVAAAITKTKALGTDGTSDVAYYISGKVSKVNQSYSASGDFGNATFFISDDGETSSPQFEAYQVMYLKGEKWVSGQEDIKVGDQVIIFGKVTYYNGTTPETVGKGAASLYSLNGIIEPVTQQFDVLTQSWTGSTSSSYVDWTGKKGSYSDAVYSGNSAGSNSSIQLRSKNSNSGIVSTTSGGKVSKVVVKWNSNTLDGRTLNVYGSSTAYSSAADLYSTDKQGTLLGTIVKGSSTELVINGDFSYVGLRSGADAMYLEEIDITWAN